MILRSTWQVLKETIKEFSEDRVMRLAAATAYYAVFSIGPLLVLVVGIAGLVFGAEQVRREVAAQTESFVGQKSAAVITSMMDTQGKGDSLVATLVGAVALVIGATGVFVHLQDSLNTIWGVTTKPGKGLGAFIRDRLFSMAMVLGLGFLLLVSMALTAFVQAFTGYISSLISMPEWAPVALSLAASFLVTAVLFAAIFKVLPDVKIRWRDVWAGALGTALLFIAGKFFLGWYLSRQADASAYGAGSALIIILLYIYYSSIILYFGAEFTQVHAKSRGATIQPSKYAVLMTDEQRADQGIPTKEQVAQADQRKAA